MTAELKIFKKEVNASLLQKTAEQNQQKSVKYKTNSPAKLYPHSLIKMLHNGWPKKHKENIKKKEKFKRSHLLVPGKLINGT